MSTRYFVPRDTTALAVGAEEIATAVQAGMSTGDELVRNGSRGAFWMEPLLEIEQGGERIGFGPLEQSEVAPVLAQDPAEWPQHPRYLGKLEEHPWFAGQQRLTFARASSSTLPSSSSPSFS